MKKISHLIKNVYIDPSIFEELVFNRLLIYRTGPADMYDLPKEYAKDIEFHNRDYKRSKSKNKVLNSLRSGQFNQSYRI